MTVEKSYSLQIKNTGISFVKHYFKEDYKAATQNWDITQDSRGVMYFANSKGLLQFDGCYWKLHKVPNDALIRSVCIDKEERIWVGGFNLLGYFKANENGVLSYHSAINLLEPQFRDFGDIWEIYADNNKLLIQTFTAILEYKEGLLRPLTWNIDIHYSFYLDGELFVKVNNSGLHKLVDNQLQPITGGDLFSDEIIAAVLPYKSDDELIITANKGFFKKTDTHIEPFRSEANPFLIKSQVYDAIFYKDYYFIGTVQNGLLILDKDLKPVQHINQKNGLQNNTVLSLFFDKDENLWLGLDNGIDYVKVNSPLSYLVNKTQAGAGYCALAYKGKLYFGTNQGLYYIDWKNGENTFSNFEATPVNGMQGQVWMLKVFDDVLYCGHDKGTFIIENNKPIQICNIAGGYNLMQYPGTDYLLQGTYSGLVIYEKRKTPGGARYVFRNKVDKFNNSGKNLIIDKDQNIWIGHDFKGIYRLSINEDFTSIYKQKHYGKAKGIPENPGLNLLAFEDQIIVSNKDGYIYYNKEKDFFYKHEGLNKTFKKEVVNKFIQGQNQKNTWFFTDQRMGILKPNFDGSYTIEYIPFIDLASKFLASYESIYFYNSSGIVISSEEGFVHFDPTFKKNYNSPYQALIRNVYTAGDSLLYGGNLIGDQGYVKKITIAYKKNSIRFLFSAPHYENPRSLLFSFFLEGFDEEWTDWSPAIEKEYTNLPAGDYIFWVKSRNDYGFESEQDKIYLTVLPPWYQTWVAYIIYVLTGLFIVFLISLAVFRKFQKEKKAMEQRQKNELQLREKEYERETLKAEQEIIKLRNEKLIIENQKKQSEIENKTKELASIAMQITYKNEMLAKVGQKLSKVSQKMIHQESKQQIEGLIKTLEKDMVRDDEWEKFELSFDQVHEDFLKKLRTKYTSLSPKDLRLCAYLRMNLSSKEIAPLLNISIRGVEISRYRLRRKLDIGRDTNLTEFMMNL